MNLGGASLRTALILGAGATRGALGEVLIKRKHVKPPLNLDFFEIASKFANADGAKSPATRRLERLKRTLKEDLLTPWPPPMETAFSLLYTAKDFPAIYAARRGRKPQPGERSELEDFLVLLADILIALDLAAAENTGYDRLAGTLGAVDTVITLNYDTALDSALFRRGWDPRTGYALLGGAKKVKWVGRRAGGLGEVPRATLLKLHGSLNWWVRGSLRSVSSVFSAKPVVVTAPRRNGQRNRLRQIIPPVFGKAFGNAHWRRLWENAFRSLCAADRIVVVGCSIVDTDFHLQALLRRVVRLRMTQGSGLKELVLVDRSRVRRRWRRALKGLGISARREFPHLEAFLTKGLGV